MSKHGIECHENCCHQMECCPRGFVEQVQNYRYMRQVTKITFFEYWWWVLKSLIGLNNAKDDDE